MKKPSNLDTEASKFYQRHSKRLAEAGLLTEATHDSYCLLCRIHSELQRLDPSDPIHDGQGYNKFNQLLSRWQHYARGFGMSTDKGKTSTDTPDEKDEFGL